MRVLYITHYTSLLGANRSMLQLILELRNKGVEPTVLLPIDKTKESDLIRELKSNGIPYIEGPIRLIKHPIWWQTLPNYLYSLSKRSKVLKALEGRQFDIIHTNSSVIDIGCYLSRKLRTKHIWHLREFGDLDYRLKTPLGKWYQRIIYGGDNYFIGISKQIVCHFQPYLGNHPIWLIYNGVKPINIIHKRHNEDTQFCIVGLLHENKRQMEVLESVNELVNNRGIKKFHVSIIGSGTKEYTDRLLKYVNDNTLDSYVSFLGYRNDIEDILGKMDVGLMTSSNEAFGRVTVEYMMAGLCVIASDGGANCEIVQDKQTGLIYHIGDYNQYFGYILRVNNGLPGAKCLIR